ncbi:carboxylesterase 1C-like [Oppia nitens]|uniref:carboxylesterase 1C-like n=1 Tax=Oppia nitens TaxID=1686743 RepID=UPI0023DB9575|nr:carboxylesterase 1C-like [Oppia nitens]
MDSQKERRNKRERYGCCHRFYSLFLFAIIAVVVQLGASFTDGSIRRLGTHQRIISSETPILTTTSGQLKGLHVIKTKRVEGYQYLGVPYAEPPVGNLRFQRPQELNESKILRDVTELAPTCIQMRHLPQLINPLLNVDEEHKTSEDCLYLNIYVPKQLSTAKHTSLPIMVWLPGEGYDFADARQFDGSFLASLGNVIVITVQYRVGVFGFLKADGLASGNMGLWDQIMALKWIRKNANAFGGDSDNITVFGRFTGSMSISILLTSPVVRDMNPSLFKRAILLSGIAVGKWVFEDNPYIKANQLLENLKCKDKDCLNRINAQTILEKASYGWKPTFDLELIEEEPLKVLEKGVFANGVTDIMLGTNKVEGSLCLLTHFAAKTRFYEKIINNKLTENDLLEMIENDMKMFFNQNEKNNSMSYQNRVFISSLVNKNQNTSLREKYLEFCSTLFITSHMKNFNKLVLKRQIANQNDVTNTPINTFMYELQYRPSFSIAPQFIESAIHGDDVLLAFGLIHNSPVLSNKDDENMTQLLVKSFTNFAAFGDPNGLEPTTDNLWSNNDISLIKSKVETITNKSPKDTISVTQLFLFSSTAEVLITFLTTSTTILALLATILICFIIFTLHKQRHIIVDHKKESALL